MKYFTYTDRTGYLDDNNEVVYPMMCNELISREQIGSLLSVVEPPQEAYATIQDYDQDGRIVGCPLYFDIDADSLLDAYQEMLELVASLRDDYELEPLTYFSGAKGFHVIAPLYIRHERCHEIAKMIADEIGDYDPQVYRTRSMWRCNNTYNKKGERFKIQVDDRWPLQQILEIAKSTHTIAIKATERFKIKELSSEELSGYVSRLRNLSAEAIAAGSSDFERDFHPCMKTLWDMEEPPQGQRHKILHIMARHCFRSGLKIDDAITLFELHPFWATVRRRDYEKVIASVYRSQHARIGCRSGSDADLLRDYCSKICPLHEGFKITDTIKF